MWAEILLELRERARAGVTTASSIGTPRRRSSSGVSSRPSSATRPEDAPPYPAVVCLSVNEEIVHGIPGSRRRWKEGDILSLDFGVELEGLSR